MATPSINQIVEQIRTAIFGKDVRENIALGIEKCYDDVSESSSNIEALVDSINDITGITIVTGWTEGSYIDLSVTNVDVTDLHSNSSCRNIVIPCSEGQIFTVNLKGGASARAWAFLNSSYRSLSKADASVTLVNEKLIAPANTAYLVMNDQKVDGEFVNVSFIGESIPSQIETTSHFVDSEGSSYKSGSDCLVNIGNASKSPIYYYSFQTSPNYYINKTTGVPYYRAGYSLAKEIKYNGENILFCLTDVGVAFVNGGGSITTEFVKADSSGDILWGDNNHSAYAISTGDIVNYGALSSLYQYVVVYVTSPTGVDAVDDINKYVKMFKVSPFYNKNCTMPFGDNPGFAPLYNSGDTVAKRSIYHEDAGKIWNISVDTKNVKYIYSDILAFDYALFDADGNCIKQLDENFKTCCITVPEVYNDAKVSKLMANIKIINRNDNFDIFDALPWIRTNLFIEFKYPIEHETTNNKGITTVISNVKTILGFYERTRSRVRPKHQSSGTTTNVYTQYVSGLLYRSIHKNIVGLSVPYETYLSGFSNLAGESITQNSGRPEDGAFGTNCAGFLFNVFQDPLFITTATLQHFKSNHMVQINDMSETTIGDVIFWDGLNTANPRSNHVAVVVDRIIVNKELQYVVTAEASSDSGSKYHYYSYPYSLGDRNAYRIHFSDLGVTPKDITVDPWFANDAAIVRNYISPQRFRESYYTRDYEAMSFWGIKHNEFKTNPATDSLMNCYVKASGGVPVHNTLSVYYNSTTVSRNFNITDVMKDGTTQNYRIIPMDNIILDGYGRYRIFVDGVYAFELYYYNKGAYSIVNNTVDISDFDTKGFDIDKTFVQVLDEHSGVRDDQFYFRPLTDSEKENRLIQVEENAVCIFTFNDLGSLYFDIGGNSGGGGSEDDE